MAREHRAEFGSGIDTRADGGAALGKRGQPRHDAFQPGTTLFELSTPTAELLRKRDRHCIHQVSASRFDEIYALSAALLENVGESQQCRI